MTKPVKFGKSVSKKNPQERKDAMERTLEFNISASNLLQMLYATGYIEDRESITSIVFRNSTKGFDVKNNPTVVVPLQVSLRKEVPNTS